MCKPKNYLLLTLFIFISTLTTLGFADELNRNVTDIHKTRLKNYNDIINSFKRFGINPDVINQVLMGTNSRKVRQQLQAYAGKVQEQNKNIQIENREEFKIALNEIRSQLYKAKMSEAAENDQTLKGRFVRLTFPLSKKLLNILIKPEVIDAALTVQQKINIKAIVLANILFLAFIFTYKKLFFKKEIPFFKRQLRNITLSIFVILATSFLIPGLIVGKPYIQLISTIAKSAQNELNAIKS